MDQTTPENEAAPAAAPGVGSRIRSSLALAQGRWGAVEARARAQWTSIPDQVKDIVEKFLVQARDRLREGLDLPSRTEISELLARVEELDGKLTELEAARAKDVASLEKKVRAAQRAAKKAGDAETAPVDKAKRKAQIKTAASKRKRG